MFGSSVVSYKTKCAELKLFLNYDYILVHIMQTIIALVLYAYVGDFSCTAEVQRAIPILKKAYGDSMHKILHVGPETCSVVSMLLKEEDTEAWGVEPYDIEDADASCKSLVRKGIVRVADIKFPLPYKKKSFSLVIVSDALDYLSPKYLNKTLPELARVSVDGLIIFTGKNCSTRRFLVHMITDKHIFLLLKLFILR